MDKNSSKSEENHKKRRKIKKNTRQGNTYRNGNHLKLSLLNTRNSSFNRTICEKCWRHTIYRFGAKLFLCSFFFCCSPSLRIWQCCRWLNTSAELKNFPFLSAIENAFRRLFVCYHPIPTSFHPRSIHSSFILSITTSPATKFHAYNFNSNIAQFLSLSFSHFLSFIFVFLIPISDVSFHFAFIFVVLFPGLRVHHVYN